MSNFMITKLPFKILNIGENGYHLLVKLYINRKVAYMVIDTGASTTVFDKTKITKYVAEKEFKEHENVSSGLGTNTMKSHFTFIKKIKLGTLEINNYSAVLLDLSHVNESYKDAGLPEIDGVLGGDILFKYNAVIDYTAKILKLKNKQK